MGFFRIVGGIILAVLAIGLAGAIFQTGYLAGVAANGTTVPVVVGPGYGGGWGWGFAGGLLNVLGFLIILALFFAILRAAFGGGRWGHRGGDWGRGWGHRHGDDADHGRYGAWEDRAKSIHDEWHRRQAADAPGGGPAGTSSGGGAPSGGAA